MEGRFPPALGIQVCKDYMTFVRACTTNMELTMKPHNIEYTRRRTEYFKRGRFKFPPPVMKFIPPNRGLVPDKVTLKNRDVCYDDWYTWQWHALDEPAKAIFEGYWTSDRVWKDAGGQEGAAGSPPTPPYKEVQLGHDNIGEDACAKNVQYPPGHGDWLEWCTADLCKLVVGYGEFNEMMPNVFIAEAYRCINNYHTAWEDFSHARNAANAGGFPVVNATVPSDGLPAPDHFNDDNI